ncbi:MAG: hypothetical protein R3F17_17065 [Planctomycetota bacterium]
MYENASGLLANGSGIGLSSLNASGLARRYLVRFDVAGSLPAGSTIVSATFEINPLSYAPAGPAGLVRDLPG